MNMYNDFSTLENKESDESIIINAYNMALCDYSKSDIMSILADNNDEIKIMPIINLKSIDNKKEFDLVLSHLTGKDGRIRETVSYILSEFPSCSVFATDEKSRKILIKALLDINPNVVRNIIAFIEKSDYLKENLSALIKEETENVLDELSKYIKESPFKENMEKSQKNHAKNKLTFNLYWLLSAISILDVNKIENLEKILTKTVCFLDYTIREKTALIVSKMANPPKELLQKLKQDENIYVKNQLL